MTEIPEDVMEAAAKAHAEFADSRVKDNLSVIIARAIMAERERAAKVAETSFVYTPIAAVNGIITRKDWADGKTIAAAIRIGPTKQDGSSHDRHTG